MSRTSEIPPRLRRRIGQAMADYQMFAEGDRVLVAVSGGIDSLVLLRLLDQWRRRAPINYFLHAVHVDMAPADGLPGPIASQVLTLAESLHLSCSLLPTFFHPDRQDQKQDTRDVCFRCARSRRTILFDFARRCGFTCLAMGHHLDDIVETFFLNLLYGGNLSTMVPKQELFSGRLALVRPLAYLEKQEVEALGRHWRLTPLKTECPLSEKTRRRDVHRLLKQVYGRVPGARKNIFAALANPRPEYLLHPAGVLRHADQS